MAIDDPEHTGAPSAHRVELERGGLATSGDARRFVRHAGRRLGHILDPRSGWPVPDAPRISMRLLVGATRSMAVRS